MELKEKIEQTKKDRLYRIVRSQVKFEGDYCDKEECVYFDGEYEHCKLMGYDLYYNYSEKNLPFLRCDECVDIFGGLDDTRTIKDK